MKFSDRIIRRNAPSWPRSKLRDGVAERLRGPGGLYNAGNLIGLTAGLSLQISAASNGAAKAAADYLAGSASALFLTAATLVFLVSGEAYHRAWRNGFPANRRLNVCGDFLSGTGALALGAALFALGQPLLAATAGLMHAFGKFGSALHRPGNATDVDWPRVFRLTVIASRVPAILAALTELARSIPAGGVCAAAPVVLLICHLLWARADVMLMKG